jgi:hypothetical protein
VPPSVGEVTGDARKPKPAPPLGPPSLAFLRTRSTPPSPPQAPCRQGAPSRSLHQHQRPPVRLLTTVSLWLKATAVPFCLRRVPYHSIMPLHTTLARLIAGDGQNQPVNHRRGMGEGVPCFQFGLANFSPVEHFFFFSFFQMVYLNSNQL